MKHLLSVFLLLSSFGFSQTDSKDRLLAISKMVGTAIDMKESREFNLIHRVPVGGFDSIQFLSDSGDALYMKEYLLGKKQSVKEPLSRWKYLDIQQYIEKQFEDSVMPYAPVPARTDGSRLLEISPYAGEVIDYDEKVALDFLETVSRRFYDRASFMIDPKGSITLEIRFTDSTSEKRPYTLKKFNELRYSISQKLHGYADQIWDKPFDKIVLKNGEVLEGKAVENRLNETVFYNGLELRTFPKSMIRSLSAISK